MIKATKIRRLLKSKGITQEQLSRITGIHRSELTMQINRKKVTYPKAAKAIAEALEVSTHDIFDDEGFARIDSEEAEKWMEK